MNTDKGISIGLVDDQELVRSGFKTIINNWENMQVTFESKEGYSVIKRFAKMENLPDILLVDLQLPNYGDLIYSGAHLTRDLREEYPEIKILILSVQDDPVTIADLIERGAHGFLSKSCAPDELHNAIESIHIQGSYINGKTLEALQRRLNGGQGSKQVNSDELTSREMEVLGLICQQLTAEEIGERLFISAKTVNGHRNNLLQKTGSRNITGLVMYAVKKGLVEMS